MYLLSDEHYRFPLPDNADENGLLAIGGDLAPERILTGYRQGIFPWFNEDEPILWWCPDPRFVLYPGELHIPKSMRPILNGRKFRITYDREFRKVITGCRQPRENRTDTWITDDMLEAYCRLHEMGFAHSVEVWKEDELAGGLYGVALGRVFSGESMFSDVPNASKAGFISLVIQLRKHHFGMIDCQLPTDHLRRFGAKEIPRKRFLNELFKRLQEHDLKGNWGELFAG